MPKPMRSASALKASSGSLGHYASSLKKLESQASKTEPSLFFEQCIGIMVRALNMAAESQKAVEMKDLCSLFLGSLHVCESARNVPSLFFYFKAASEFSQVKSERELTTSRLANIIKKRQTEVYYSALKSLISSSSLSISDYQINYTLDAPSYISEFLIDVSLWVCSYFTNFCNPRYADIFKHYALPSSQRYNRRLTMAAVIGLMKCMTKYPDQFKKEPLPFQIMPVILVMYHKRPQHQVERGYFIKYVSLLAHIMQTKSPEYLSKNHSHVMTKDNINKVLVTVRMLDSQDEGLSGRSLVYSIAKLRLQQNLLNDMPLNLLVVTQDTKIQQMIYLTQLHLPFIDKAPNRIEQRDIIEIEQKLGTIAHKILREDQQWIFGNIIRLMCSEVSNRAGKLQNNFENMFQKSVKDISWGGGSSAIFNLPLAVLFKVILKFIDRKVSQLAQIEAQCQRFLVTNLILQMYGSHPNSQQAIEQCRISVKSYIKYLRIHHTIEGTNFIYLLTVLMKMMFLEGNQQATGELTCYVLSQFDVRSVYFQTTNFDYFFSIFLVNFKNIQSKNSISVLRVKVVIQMFEKLLECIDGPVDCILEDDAIMTSLNYATRSLLCYYDQMDPQDDIACLSSKIASLTNSRFVKFYAHHLRLNIDKAIGLSSFCKEKDKQKMVLASIGLMKSLYQNLSPSRDMYTAEQQLVLIDFIFHLKRDLRTIMVRLESKLNQQMSVFRPNIAQLLDEVESFEFEVFHCEAVSVVDSLFLNLREYKDRVEIFLSIALKKLYFVANRFQNNNNLAEEQPEDRKTDQKDKTTFDMTVELDQCVMNRKTLNSSCLYIFDNLEKMSILSKPNLTLPFLPLFSINRLVPTREIICQLNDLLYVFHLCELDEQCRTLMGLRLSLCEALDSDLSLLELSKYYFLDMFQKQEKPIVKQLIQHKLGQDRNKYALMIGFLISGELPESFPYDNNVSNLLYLLTVDPILALMKTRSGIRRTSAYSLGIMYLNAQVEEQRYILQSTRRVIDTNSDHYWSQDSWFEGWTVLRLMILYIRRHFSVIFQTNQLSKAKSFLHFSEVVLVRSGHLEELVSPWIIRIQRQMNIVSVLDSLKNLVSDKISRQKYEKLVRMFEKTRKSHAFRDPGNVFTLINSTFEKCKKIGFLMAKLCSELLTVELELNLAQKFIYQWNCPIFSTKFQQIDQQIYNIISSQGPKRLQEWVYISNKLIFESYGHALIFKDFIGKQLSQSLNQQLPARTSQLIDQQIAILAVIYQDYNYSFKQFIKDHLNEKQDMSFSKLKVHDMAHKCQKISAQFEGYKQAEMKSNMEALMYCKQISYPLSVLFPLGDYFFNIAFKDQLLVTFVPKTDLDDRIFNCQKILQSNQKVLKSSTDKKDASQRATQRASLDKQLGKLANSVDIGICDIDRTLLPYGLMRQLSDIHPALFKFLGHSLSTIQLHLSILAIRYELRVNVKELSRKIFAAWQDGFSASRQNILINLNSNYIQFPIESTEILSSHDGVYRVPSISYVLSNQKNIRKDYNPCKLKYVVNNRNDLAKTEQRFNLMKDKNGYQQWSGVTKRNPEVPLYVRSLFSRDIFLFMGHGSGFQHISDHQLYRFEPNCLMMIFGCGSARMVFEYSEPQGSALKMLMCGCPTYLGCLWSITDVDSDRMTDHIFSARRKVNLSLLVKQSKKRCCFPHLNGAAHVIYGLPAYISRGE